jgi:alginate O-acetyltransferase complex protein AlgI
MIRELFVPWVWMWFVGFTIFFGFKFLTLLRLDATCRQPFMPGMLAAYLFLWPGLGPRVFVEPALGKPRRAERLLANGCLQLFAGAAALWVVPRWLPASSPSWHCVWIGMVGFSLFLHFGLFDLLAVFWRSKGIPVEKLFSNPWRSISLTDFWSNRWNRSFSDFARSMIFRPLARRWGTGLATLAVFTFSGFIHEMMISVPARGGYGGPMMYFIMNGLAVWTETQSGWRKLTQAWPVLGRIWAMTLVIAPLPLLFHAPFQTRVVLPFLNALGATA